jgi:hypothetical protein
MVPGVLMAQCPVSEPRQESKRTRERRRLPGHAVIARVLGSAAALIKVYRPALLIWRREEVSSGAVPHPSLAAVVSKGRALDEGQKYPAGPAFSNEESVEWSRVAVMRARADMSY